MGEVVVTPVKRSRTARKRRAFDERLVVRFPGAARRFGALGMRLVSPRSRLRRAVLRRIVQSGWACGARQDWDLMLTRYAPDVEWHTPEGGFATLGFSDKYRGHAGVREAMSQFSEAYERWEMRLACVLDLGDRLLNMGMFDGRARASGVDWQQPFAQLITVRDGLVTHECSFYSWEDGLRAAGLDPSMVAELPLESARA
jgi:ketosteroid isomerase-like protein